MRITVRRMSSADALPCTRAPAAMPICWCRSFRSSGSPPPRGWRSERCAGLEIGLHDLLARGLPYVGMAADVLERRIEPADAMRDADDEGVQADGHHPRRAFPLAVEDVELPLADVLALV